MTPDAGFSLNGHEDIVAFVVAASAMRSDSVTAPPGW